MSNISETKPKQAKNKKYMLVRYGRMNALAFFEHHENEIPKVHSRVVIKTERGLELGYIVGQLCSYRGGQFRLREEQIKEYFDKSEIDLCPPHAGKFVRYATADDISEERHLRKIVQEEIDSCKRIIKAASESSSILCPTGGWIFASLSKRSLRNTRRESKCVKSAHGTRRSCSAMWKAADSNAAARGFSSFSSR
jgi:hypothetical protein